MIKHLIWRDITRNKVVSLTTLLFIAAAALLMSLAATLAVNLTGAIDQLMQEAKTPHFMQMHAGTLDLGPLVHFAAENEAVADFQILKFLNISADQITLSGHSLAGSVVDHGVSTQSQRFDLLLDLDNIPVQPKSGELYVPISYYKDGTTKLGDQAIIGGRSLVVAGFVRDSQMNSTLASSKRFLVSAEDYALLEPLGSVEYLIEFRLHDLAALDSFATAYSAAALPANGPTLTWPLFRLISAVSDGMMIAVIVLIAVLVIFIALLCVRFTLLAKIEDDYREIGVMRAIGLRVSSIGHIYLAVYAALAAAGSLLGYLLALLLQDPLRESIRLNLGDGANEAAALLLGAAGAIGIFLLILLYVRWNLRRFRQMSVVQALRFGADSQTGKSLGRLSLAENRWLSINLFLGLKDVLTRKRLYITMLTVISLASFMLIVPQNLYHTLAAENFVSYMGMGRCDLRLDIQQTEHLSEKAAAIGEYLAADQTAARYAILETKLFSIKLADGTRENLQVELGDHTIFPIQYMAGSAPVRENELALSVLNAQALGKTVGEQVTLVTAEGERPFTICGIYSDITNGGKTAKAAFTDQSAKAVWITICVTLNDGEPLTDVTNNYASLFPYAKVSNTADYITQTFGQTLQSVRLASWAALLVAATVTLLVTLLFIKLLVAKDRSAIAAMRALGFTASDIRWQYGWRAVIILAAGLVLGTLLAETLGEKIFGAALASFGAASFHFTTSPLSATLLSLLTLLLSALLAAAWGTRQAGEVSIYASLKE